MALSARIYGQHKDAASPLEALGRAQMRAANMPDLLVEAQKIAANVNMGWHGRKKRGAGNEFWQYRPYSAGENPSQIDWRRSARDDQTYLRDREWEAAHTVWIWADDAAGMQFQSAMADVSKQSRALVLALAIAELASRAGERIEWPQLLAPISARNGAERLAERLHVAQPLKPEWSDVKPRSELVYLSDFLKPLDVVFSELKPLLERNIRGHLVMVLDPVEEVFPYEGQTEFKDPISGVSHNVGRAEYLKADYQNLLTAHREALHHWCQRAGWSFTVHRTDQKATQCLSALYRHLEEAQA